MHIETGKSGKLKIYADSVQEVFWSIGQQGWKPERDKSSDSRSHSDGFNTFGNLKEANDVFLNNPESIRGFSILDEKLVSREAPGKDVQFDVTGDYIDIDRYLEGVPENFGQAIMGNPRTVFATINVLLSAVHWTSAEYMLHKQKRVMRLVDWLEQQGIRTQIVLSADSEVWHAEIIVKQFHDPFDLNQLAVGMHPDFFRRTCFLIMEQSKTWTWGYGSSLEYDARMLKHKSNEDDGLYVYVGGYIPYENNSTKKLDEDFDKIEDHIQNMIDLELTFVDADLKVGGGTRGY
jgi:hypothetical protein